MTITPTTPADPAVPAIPGAPAPGAAGDSAAADFLAAILLALAPGADAATDAAAAPAEPAMPETDPAALGLVVPPGLAAQLVPPPVVAGSADGNVPGHANVADEAQSPVIGPASDIRMSGYATATATATATGAATGATAAARPGTSGWVPTPVARGDAAGGTPTSVTPAADGPARPDDTTPAAPPAAPPTAPPVTSTDLAAPSATAAGPVDQPAMAATPTVAVGAPSGAAASTPVASESPPAPQVTGQVFPEVSRLVSRGDGTHRITLSLYPEALGEVRVVMTVRDGAVHVRFAAGHDARQALAEGAAELNRLLGLAGASETRIVVRDLPAPAATTTADPSAGPDLATGDNRPHDQHAGTRAEHPATDGTETTTPTARGTGANPPRSSQPVTHTRAAGVDVTM